MGDLVISELRPRRPRAGRSAREPGWWSAGASPAASCLHPPGVSAGCEPRTSAGHPRTAPPRDGSSRRSSGMSFPQSMHWPYVPASMRSSASLISSWSAAAGVENGHFTLGVRDVSPLIAGVLMDMAEVAAALLSALRRQHVRAVVRSQQAAPRVACEHVDVHRGLRSSPMRTSCAASRGTTSVIWLGLPRYWVVLVTV